MRNIHTLLLAAILMLSGCGPGAEESKRYVPRSFDGDRLVERPDLKTDAHMDRVEHVLGFYGVEYERKGNLIISLRRPMTHDYMWNLTSKAEDPEWIESHPVREGR